MGLRYAFLNGSLRFSRVICTEKAVLTIDGAVNPFVQPPELEAVDEAEAVGEEAMSEGNAT